MTDAAFIFDKAYQERVSHILMEALVLGLMDDKRRSVWRTGDIAEVMLKLTAMLLGDSSLSQTELRRWTEEHGRRLYRNALTARAQYAAEGSPFTSVTIDGAVN